MDAECPLCQRLARGGLVVANAFAVAIPDAFPVSPGHALIVPRRHVADFFDLTAEEQAGLWMLLPLVKETIDAAHAPPAYNIGVNVGAAAGQTVAHVHVHLIPRYAGDVPDPRGGVRWVLPARAAYWSRQP